MANATVSNLGQAAGAGKLLTRTTGAVMNPNMDLLFNSPNMRNLVSNLDLLQEIEKKQ